MGCVSSQPRRAISLPENLADLSNGQIHINNTESFQSHVQLLPPALPISSRRVSNGNAVAANGHARRQYPTFNVSALPNQGGKAITGKLEVTETEVILHRSGHTPLTWPLNFLRRYGYEDGIFSFESGRRCQSGPGVFTFRCTHAEELFHLVQKNIQDHASSQFPNSVPPVIWERITSNAPDTEIAVRTPNRPINHPKNDTYMRPNSACLLTDEHTLAITNGSVVKGQSSDALVPCLDHPEQDLKELAIVNIRPRIESKPKSARPASLVLPSSNTLMSMMMPSSDSTQMLTDNVFSSPGFEDPQSPLHAYVNVQPASGTNSPAQSVRGRKCFSDTSDADTKTPEAPERGDTIFPRNRLRAPYFGRFASTSGEQQSPGRKTSHMHSFSDVTSNRRTPTSLSYVNFRDSPAPQSPRAMVDYVTLSVGPSPSQSPLPTSFSFRRERTALLSPKRPASTSASPLATFNTSSLGRTRLAPNVFTPDAEEREVGRDFLTPGPVENGGGGASNYAKIDYDKTRALKETSRVNTVDRGVRRNRHDSAAI